MNSSREDKIQEESESTLEIKDEETEGNLEIRDADESGSSLSSDDEEQGQQQVCLIFNVFTNYIHYFLRVFQFTNRIFILRLIKVYYSFTFKVKFKRKISFFHFIVRS